MKGKPAFPNDTFKSQEEYFKFATSHSERGAWIFGEEAYKLKKEEDKQAKILEPKLKPR